MPSVPSALMAAAGEHYVAYMLSKLGFVAALTRGGSPAVDLMVGDLSGKRTVSLQVKTTEHALRERGRGNARKPDHLEFPLGTRDARISDEKYFFAFVDMRIWESKDNEAQPAPDVYIVPSEFVEEYSRPWVDTEKWLRFHVGIIELAQYKNNWSLIAHALK